MQKSQIILGIESSCDETAASIGKIMDSGVQILSNVVASSLELQAKYGGVVPEQAAREQLKSIIPVIEESLQVAGYREQDIDAIAVTQGPGLIGSLLVGVETAKTLALVWNKPLVPVNHLIGHFYANWITDMGNKRSLRATALGTSIMYQGKDNKTHNTKYISQIPSFPAIGLLVSGGHTDLVLIKDHGKFEYIGGTRDDAAGECFDKCARLLGLPYPGGPVISKLAKDGNPKAFNLPRPMIDSGDFDFSFSGLKTAVANLVNQMRSDEQSSPASQDKSENRSTDTPTHRSTDTLISSDLSDIAASIEAAIVDVLVKKTVAAARKYNVEQVIVAGGVAANQKLAETMARVCESLSVKLFIPPSSLCTDNAAMIVAAAFFNYQEVDPLTLQANPNLSLSH